jgi:Squalene-hopene cyclase C-terminal domain
MPAISIALLLIGQLVDRRIVPLGLAPEARAVAFLSREVPRWSRQNHCFSCHNNGDAARALLEASEAGYHVPEIALVETITWLRRPGDWEHNGGKGPYNDKRLARVAFTAALATAVKTRRVQDREALVEAAGQLALDQAADGSWPIEGDDTAGAPATYGRPLATLLSRESLAAAEPARFRASIDRADAWLLKHDMQTVTDASVSLLALAAAKRSPPADRQNRGLELLSRAQAQDGGWGPDKFSPPEPFDTALALLALSKCDSTPPVRLMIARGRKYLISEQLDDGSWTETTRPAGNVSYAERISTTGWATMALLATAARELPVKSQGPAPSPSTRLRHRAAHPPRFAR